jgi:hypothetical protein
MKTKAFSPMGALHPILFFAGVYVVVLVFSIFICSALFYSCNTSPSSIGEEKTPVQEQKMASQNATSAVVMR